MQQICATNTTIKAICDDDFFWKSRFEQDYPDLKISPLPIETTYKQTYQAFYSTGIADKLQYPITYSGSVIYFIKPRPPYRIQKIFTPELTELGGTEQYIIMPDITLGKLSDRWRAARYPRSDVLDNLKRVPQTEIKYFTSDNESIDYINSLVTEGYYQITNGILTSSQIEKLNKKGYIHHFDDIIDIQEL